MKKNLLTVGVLLLSFPLIAQNVLTYVGNGATVTVQNNALVYNGGGWQNVGTVSNTGDIMIDGSSADKFEVAGTSDFRLAYTDSDTYGQLYITGVPQGQIIGSVNKDYRADANHSTFGSTNPTGRQQMALPFVGYTLGDLKSVLESNGAWLNTTSTTLNYTGRFNVASLFKWHNGVARYNQIVGDNATVLGTPTDYFILPRRSQDASGQNFTEQWDAAADLKTFSGRPSSDEAANTTVSITGGSAVNFGTNGNGKNYFGERYHTYILDPFRAGGPSPAVWHSDYGKNLYQFGNPFLTNLDLTYIAIDETVPAGESTDGINLQGVVGVAVLGANSLNWQNGVGTTNTMTNVHNATVSGGVFQGGDVDAVRIKPLTPFYIKMDGSATASTDFNLSNTRRFAQTPRSANTGYHVTSNRGALNIPTDKIVKQVAVVLKDNSGNEMGRTYYAVSPSAVTGKDSNELQSYVNNYPIYTKEEIAGGGADDSQAAYKLYINAANEIDFARKEIPLVINAVNGTSVSFELYEAGQRLEAGQTFTNGKSFYIKNDNVVTEIKDGDALAYGSGDYGLYYEAPEGFLGTSATAKSSTIIARKANVWVVRFADSWKTADVEVYSAAGQLLSAKKNVSTATDYIIPLRSDANGMFLVKAVSHDGEVVIKKIVK